MLVLIIFCKRKYAAGIVSNRKIERYGESNNSLLQTARHAMGVAGILK